ncbi:unnamed protein product [Calypogeia fissa]
MAPPSLSMSITPQASSDSSVTGAGFRPRDEMSDFQRKSSSSVVVSDVVTDIAAREETQQEGYKKEVEDKKLLSNEEILRRKKEGEALIVVDGNVYDVTEFLETHPGGAELILEHLKSEGVQDAGPLMRGKLDEDGHSHSKAAFQMLEQFFVGSLKAAPGAAQSQAHEAKKYRYNIDLTKPIVAQVGYLGPDYHQWVHDPIVSTESPRFFENDINEFFTRTKWWVIPLIWVPVAVVMFYMSLVVEKVPLYRLPGNCAVGVVIWTLLEYLLHRFVFHMKTSSYWGNTLHYFLHGFHHKHPMDGARLVFPPAITLLIAITIWVTVGDWFAPYRHRLSMYAAGLLAYVVYDLTHYYLHFGTAFNDETRKMKRYHLNHHFKDQTNGYGITTTMWDSLFRTQPKMSVD